MINVVLLPLCFVKLRIIQSIYESTKESISKSCRSDFTTVVIVRGR